MIPTPMRWVRRLPLTIKQVLEQSTASTSQQEEITVTGWVRSVRAQKRVAFAQINDGSCFKSLQAVLTPEEATRSESDAQTVD